MEDQGIYLGKWAEGRQDGIISDFGIHADDLKGAGILVASYDEDDGDQSGSAYVLFERGGKFWEVHASHCSCHGLGEENHSGGDTQWRPEEAYVPAIRQRAYSGRWNMGDETIQAVRQVLETIEKGAYEGKWDFDGSSAPAEGQSSGTHPGQETFTLGCFRWVRRAKGTGLKRGKVEHRVKGRVDDSAAAYEKARAFCAEKNGHGGR